MAFADYLFTHFYLVIPLSLDMYYMSFESQFQGDLNAVEIVGIGLGGSRDIQAASWEN